MFITRLVNIYDQNCGQWKHLGTLPSPQVIEGMNAYRQRFIGTDEDFYGFFTRLIATARATGGKWFQSKLTPNQIFNANRLPLLEFWETATNTALNAEQTTAIAGASRKDIEFAQFQQALEEYRKKQTQYFPSAS